MQLPALQSAQPVPLLKYSTTPRWRPVPVFVDASLGAAGSSAAQMNHAAEPGQGEVRIHATIEPNPQLKTPLQNVSLPQQPTNYSLRSAHCLLLTAHCSLLTAHYSLLTAHCSLLTTH